MRLPEGKVGCLVFGGVPIIRSVESMVFRLWTLVHLRKRSWHDISVLSAIGWVCYSAIEVDQLLQIEVFDNVRLGPVR